MRNKSIKYVISFVLLVAVLVVGYSFYNKSKYISYDSNLYITEGKVLAKINGRNITDTAIINYRKYNQGKLASTFINKDIINMFVQDELFLQIAKDNGIKISKEQVQSIVNENRALIEKNNPSLIDSIIKDLGLTTEEYWEDYVPRAYATVIAISKAREKVENSIIDEISKTHPEWTQEQNKEEIDAAYNAKFKELKKEYNVEIF